MAAFALSSPLLIRSTTISTSPISSSRPSYVPSRSRTQGCTIRMCDKPARPEGSTITNALELSFRSVWVQLLTAGVGPQYEQAIQQFVVSCATAYKAGYSLTALKFELMNNEKDTMVDGVDTRLNEREKETRMVWIALVYMTLAEFKFESVNPPPRVEYDVKGTSIENYVGGLRGLTARVIEAAKSGQTLQTFKLNLSLSDPPPGESVDPKIINAQKNMRSQWSRIVFATLGILPDSTKGFKSANR